MSNPTSNFGWQMPEPTDLVTDLPADFEVFGQAVDTDFADLLGGTTGQVLSKTSNTDLDFTWVAANAGDITGVTAGTGISGGGTSGTVTVTNDMATTITAAGDILVGTGSGTYDNLPIGTTGQILTADTSVSPYKVKWAAPAGGGKVLQVVQAQTTTTTTIASTTYTDTTLSASITPSSASSKVLIMITQQFFHTRGVGAGGASETGLGIKLLRGSTDILNLGGTNADKTSYLYVNAGASSGRELAAVLGASYLDSPSTTSSTTYKTQSRVASTNDAGSSTFQGSSTPSTMLLLEIGA